MSLPCDRLPGRTDSDQSSPGPNDLASAEVRVKRARELSHLLFKEAKRMPQYKIVLASKDRVPEFRERLLEKAHFINRKLNPPLQEADVEDVTTRLVGRVAVWDHSPDRQRERQKKQAVARRRKTRGRDLLILRLHEKGISKTSIAKEVGLSRGGVYHVLKRDLTNQRKPGDRGT